MTQPRLYLDLDGVIYPIGSAPEGDSDVAMLHKREWWRPSVTRRIGSLGVEVVMSSSWGEGFIETSPEIASPLDDLRPVRALNEKRIYESGSKIGVIEEDMCNHPVEAAIWIDDEVTLAAAARFGQLATHTLVIVPRRREGLRSEHLDTVESFMRRLENS